MFIVSGLHRVFVAPEERNFTAANDHLLAIAHHKDTENTEGAQRKTEIRTLVGELRHSSPTAVTGHQSPFTVSSEQPKRAHQVVSKTERPG
jgi:hypothetical protein